MDRALDPESVVEAAGTGCVARRRESYYSAVAARHAAGVERAPRRTVLDATG
jgi:RNA polymerase sigma factor for flagellar operon FliA